MWPRAIIHVDMDAFYASVEQLDNPELRDKPVVVGGSAKGRGVVCAASYAARKFGIHSAMPASRARRLCPHGIFLPVRMGRYTEVSKQVHEIFLEFTPMVQPVSVDEAFLDITGSQRLMGAPGSIARQLKQAVKARTGLTASVGVAPTRFAAKLASDLEKPDGLVVIPRDQIMSRLEPLPVSRIWGVGKVTAGKLSRLGIQTIGDLRTWPEQSLTEHFGNAGKSLWALAHGLDPSPVNTKTPEKSISNETTFPEDICSIPQLEHVLIRLSDKVARRLRTRNLRGRTIQLKLRYNDFTTITRRQTLPEPTCVGDMIFSIARRLLRERSEAGTRPARLIGVGVSGFDEQECRQMKLFTDQQTGRSTRREAVERTTDAICDKLGPKAIGRASSMLQQR